MGYPLTIAQRYIASKKRAFVAIGTVFATLGVALGVAALTVVMSVTGGFQEQFREKVLGVNAHVLVLKYSSDFREYRDVMKKVEGVPGVLGIAPFVISPMMVTHGERTATGVLLKGVDPTVMPSVLDLPKHIVEGSLDGMRREGAKPPLRRGEIAPALGGDVGSPLGPAVDGDGGSPTVESAAAGVTSQGDTPDGGRLGLLEAIERQIREDDAAAAQRAAEGSPRTPTATDVPRATPPAGRRDGSDPVGSIVPKGGYASVLPDDDALPPEIDPDPCADPRASAQLAGAAVGKALARQLRLSLGDCIQVTSPTIGVAFGASGRPPVAKQFRVIAVFEAGFEQYDSKLIYTDLYEAQAFYEYGDSVTGVEMKIADIDRSGTVAKEIDARLANGIYHTMDWRELNHGLFTALLIQKIGMSVVLALMIIVAAFTVIATLIMMVIDKKKEVAILKALGAPDGAVMRIFLYQGAIIGGVGTSTGLALGYVACRGLVAWAFPLDPKVYFISKLPVNVRPEEFAIAGAFAIVTCVIATVFPALHAARLRPADGLRAE